MIAHASAATDLATTFVEKLNEIILFPLIVLLTAIAAVYFLWGCFQFVMNANNETARETGKKHILWGIIGLLIMLSAWAILTIVLTTFGIRTPAQVGVGGGAVAVTPFAAPPTAVLPNGTVPPAPVVTPVSAPAPSPTAIHTVAINGVDVSDDDAILALVADLQAAGFDDGRIDTTLALLADPATRQTQLDALNNLNQISDTTKSSIVALYADGGSPSAPTNPFTDVSDFDESDDAFDAEVAAVIQERFDLGEKLSDRVTDDHTTNQILAINQLLQSAAQADTYEEAQAAYEKLERLGVSTPELTAEGLALHTEFESIVSGVRSATILESESVDRSPVLTVDEIVAEINSDYTLSFEERTAQVDQALADGRISDKTWEAVLLENKVVNDYRSVNGDPVVSAVSGEAAFRLSEGEEFRAVFPGEVVSLDPNRFDSKEVHVVVRHDDGTYARYEFLSADSIAVAVGERVVPGTTVLGEAYLHEPARARAEVRPVEVSVRKINGGFRTVNSNVINFDDYSEAVFNE